jgi:hypothetical protein
LATLKALVLAVIEENLLTCFSSVDVGGSDILDCRGAIPSISEKVTGVILNG